MTTHHGMDAIGADEHVGAHGLAAHAGLGVREMRDDPALVLHEPLQPEPRAHCAGTESRNHFVVDHLLQTAAMDRELRIVEARVQPTQLGPHLLPKPADVMQFLGADADGVKLGQKIERGQLLDGVGQNVDADADFPDLGSLFVNDALDAPPVKHERKRQSAEARACDEHFQRRRSLRLTQAHFACSGGGRKSTSCLAESATTSAGVCSAMLWIPQKRS